MKKYNSELAYVKAPRNDCAHKPVILSDETMNERKGKVLSRMKREGLDVIAVYCDVEHSGNFEYLTGFFTRFEEGILFLRQNGEAVLCLGNENLNKASKSRIKADAVHCPYFSLPNQPMKTDFTFREIIEKCGIKKTDRVGIVGWKNFTSEKDDNSQLYDVPSFITDTIKSLCRETVNATHIFIGENGSRVTCNADEAAHYEYGASLASDCVINAMNSLREGIRETEVGALMSADGQMNSVVTIAAFGERFAKRNMFPADRKLVKGDTVSLTCGYKGGLSSRNGFAVNDESEIPDGQKDYIGRVVKPYFECYAMWLENIRIGMTGGELWNMVNEILPQSVYGWALCPGHLTADEEWLSSPVYENSGEKLKSGMIFQIDIIPSVKGYAGTSAESTVMLRDENLRNELREKFPEMCERIRNRQEYIRGELGINIPDYVLPMCAGVRYLRPFMMAQGMAMKITK